MTLCLFFFSNLSITHTIMQDIKIVPISNPNKSSGVSSLISLKSSIISKVYNIIALPKIIIIEPKIALAYLT